MCNLTNLKFLFWIIEFNCGMLVVIMALVHGIALHVNYYVRNFWIITISLCMWIVIFGFNHNFLVYQNWVWTLVHALRWLIFLNKLIETTCCQSNLCYVNLIYLKYWDSIFDVYANSTSAQRKVAIMAKCQIYLW